MKEFEKWWEKHRASNFPCTCQSARRENLGMLADRYIWKAAFENMQQWLMGRRCTGEDVLDYINKELGNA